MQTAAAGKSCPTTATIEFRLWNTMVHAELPVPAGPAGPTEMMPAYRALTEAVVEVGLEASKSRGETVSCRKGCGACCRQLVPISEPEARELHALVEALPEPRRTKIRERFQRAREIFLAAGVLEKLEHLERFTDRDVRSLGLEYFRVGVPCPFLEDESCSIHPDRPLVCRQYLVTSPSERCADPSPEKISVMPIPADVSSNVRRIGMNRMPWGAMEARFVRWVPLILALEWVEDHGEEEAEATGPEQIQELFKRLEERRNR